jgi:non-homologous end joining protein Ku
MSAHAIWKGTLLLGQRQIHVKMYSAVEDQAIHFHLLHNKDLSPGDQRMVQSGRPGAVAQAEFGSQA